MSGPIGNEGDSGRYSLEELREKHAKMKEATAANMLLQKNQSQSTVGGDFNAAVQSTSVSIIRHPNQSTNQHHYSRFQDQRSAETMNVHNNRNNGEENNNTTMDGAHNYTRAMLFDSSHD